MARSEEMSGGWAVEAMFWRVVLWNVVIRGCIIKFRLMTDITWSKWKMRPADGNVDDTEAGQALHPYSIC